MPKEGCEQSSTSRGAMKGMPIEGHNLFVKEGQVSLVKIMEEIIEGYYWVCIKIMKFSLDLIANGTFGNVVFFTLNLLQGT